MLASIISIISAISKNIDPMTLCTAPYEHKNAVVGFGSFNDDTFVRLVTINANNSKQDILNFFKVLEKLDEKSPNLPKVKVAALELS